MEKINWKDINVNQYYGNWWVIEQDSSLFIHSPNPTYLIDLNHNILSVNPAAVEISGYLIEEMLQMPFLNIMTSKCEERNKPLFETAKQGIVQKYETTLENKSGRPIDVMLTVIPYFVGKQIVGMIGIA